MRVRKAAILQSAYIPWKGYFDLMGLVDEFIIFDDARYSKNDWRNRNIIKTPQGLKWITIPVNQKGILSLPIHSVTVCEPDWGRRHWSQFVQYYSAAPFFDHYAGLFSQLYHDNEEVLLSKINCKFIKAINQILDIPTRISFSSDYHLHPDKNQRLINLCKEVNASVYLSGPAAAGYLDVDLFNREDVEVEWMDYGDYPEYPQLYGPFTHKVTILDLLFNTGTRAKEYMKCYNKV